MELCNFKIFNNIYIIPAMQNKNKKSILSLLFIIQLIFHIFNTYRDVRKIQISLGDAT